MPDVSQIEQRLRNRLRELTERLEKAESELDQPMNADTEDRVTEREGDEVLEGLGNSGLAEIRMIEAALDWIRDRTFGKCVECGDPISVERLDSVLSAAGAKGGSRARLSAARAAGSGRKSI